MTVNTIAAVASASSLAAAALFAVWLVYYGRQRSAERQVRRQLRRLSRRIAQLEGRLEPHSIVPPMHIFLERTQRQWHAADELCHRIDGWLQQHGFQRIGYFQIEELGGEELCAYLSADHLLVGAVRMPTGAAEPYVEFCFDLGQGRRGGVSNPPSSTVGLPSDAVGRYFPGRLSRDFSLLDRMYLAARQLLRTQSAVPAQPERIAEFFEEAHAFEMACRVSAGGISEQEIRDALKQQGVLPSARQVAIVQGQWQSAIDDYLLEFSAEGKNRLALGQRLLVVHGGSLKTYLGGQIRSMMLPAVHDARVVEPLIDQFDQLLSHHDPREAVARMLPHLPRYLRLELVDRIGHPVEADVYTLHG